MKINAYSFSGLFILLILFQIKLVEDAALADSDLHNIAGGNASGGVNIRLRNEYWNTFTKEAASNDRVATERAETLLGQRVHGSGLG